MKYILLVIFLSLPVTAHAERPESGTNAEMASHARALPQQRAVEHVRSNPVQPVVHPSQPTRQPQAVRHDQQVDHRQDDRGNKNRDYFRRDTDYYGHIQVPFPVADVDPVYVVPDGYETVIVNGETFYYNDGSFYQEINDQLTAVPAVLGAVVDSIPTDYEIVMADGGHYLLTRGVYYQRVDGGFEVVQPPTSDQE